MLKITFTFLFTLFIVIGYTQFVEQWNAQYAISDYDRAYGVAINDNGEYIVCGQTFDTENRSYDGKIVKIDYAGNEIWTKSYGAAKSEELNHIISLTNGNYLTVGHTSSKGEGDKDIWIIQINDEGEIIWEKTYGEQYEDKASHVIQTKDGGFLVTGYKMIKSSSTIEAWVIKLDADGEKQWDKTYPNTFRSYFKSAIEEKEGYVLGGYIHPSSGEEYKDDMGRVLKITTTGEIIWEKVLGTEKEDAINKIIPLNEGGYAFAGYSSAKEKGYHEIWTGVLNEKGEVVWQQTFGDESKDHAVDVLQNNKGILVTGFVNSRESSSEDVVLLQYDLKGNLLSETFFGGSLNNEPHQAILAPDGSIVIAGEVCTHYQYNSEPVKCKMQIIKTTGSPLKSIQNYVTLKTKSWEKKGEFEKTEDFQKRVTDENRKMIIEKHTCEAIAYFGSNAVDFSAAELSEYNADEEKYTVTIPSLGEFPLSIELEDAQSLKEGWNLKVFEEPVFEIENNKFILKSVVLVVRDKELTYNTPKAQGEFIVTGKRELQPLSTQMRGGGGDPLKGLNVSQSKNTINSGNYYALIIGVDNYKGHWSQLNNAVRDAQAVELLLKKNYKFNHFKTLYDEQATRENIINGLSWLVNNVKPQDNVFIYYSGHGEYNKKLNKGFWVPADAQTSSVAAYISNSDIQTFLNGINSNHTLLVADACFSGDIFRGNTVKVDFENSEKYYQEVHKLKSRQAITSGGVEPVMDGGRNGHSVFAYYFLKSLQANQQQYFDAATLYESLKVPVANNSDQTPSLQPVKNTGDEGGQFIFIKK